MHRCDLGALPQGIMRIHGLFAFVLAAPFPACRPDQAADRAQAMPVTGQPILAPSAPVDARPDPNLFDMAHRTCALYVAVHSAAWQRPMTFGNDADADDVRWNMCPGGTMVACAVAPDANGDSVRTGIPWPYPPPATH